MALLGILSYHLIPGFDPTSVSRVAPDWDLSGALPTEHSGAAWWV